MGSALNIRRKLETLNYEKNASKSIALPRNYSYQGLYLTLKAVITIVTADATAYTNAPWKLIKRIEVIANGRDSLKNIDGVALAMLNKFMQGAANYFSTVPVAVGASQAFESSLYLPFAMPRAVKPVDTYLNAPDFGTLEFRITFGSEADMYSANSANVTITSASVSVQSLESIGAGRAPLINKVGIIEKEVTATASEFSVPINVGNSFRGFLVRAEVDGNPSDSVINSVVLRSGTEVYCKTDYNQIRNENKLHFGVESMPSGYLFIDFCPDGYLTESLDTKGFSNLELVCDVTKQSGTNKITVYPIELITAALN